MVAAEILSFKDFHKTGILTDEMIIKKLFVYLIRFYQLALSPFLGPCCRFYPSCSEYAREAIEAHGVCFGVWLAFKRIIKCGPWNHGGYDPIPEKKTMYKK